MKTFRRDRLFRLAQAGRLVMTGAYHFDDMQGASRESNKEVPVRVSTEHGDCREGFCNVRKYEFEGHGRAWVNPDNSVTLYVHSNSNYTFRILDEAPAAPAVVPEAPQPEGPTYPTLHLNGSGGEALFEQVCEALGAVRKATDALCAMNPHGRDYYVQGPEALGKAQKAHNDRLQKLRDVRLELEAFAENVRDQIDARRR